MPTAAPLQALAPEAPEALTPEASAPETLALFGSLGPWEIGIILVVGVLIFGKRLPEVGRNVGKSFVEFKKGLAGATDEINKAKQEADRLSHDDARTVETKDQEKTTESTAPKND